MHSFNVLDRSLNIHRHYLLEASAGTGKTYSIENIAARLLLDEGIPYTLEQILIVTYTKAACNDLKKRMRENLHKILHILKKWDCDCAETLANVPDYLVAIKEKGPKSLHYAQKQIIQALTFFDQAPIYTIHGFCSRMLKEHVLEGNVSAQLSSEEEGIPSAQLYRLIHDFFRTEIKEDLVSPAQLEIVIKAYKGIEKLESKLLIAIGRNIEIEAAPLTKDASNPDHIFTILAKRCKHMVDEYLQKEELVGPNELLQRMHRAVSNPEFADRIRKRFRSAIIDEFQDTDPVQWEIFNSLFLKQKDHTTFLTLVGDPKQSIYGFRQGDIYTYLEAGNSLGKEHHASLDTNFRSTPQLIEALNALFDPELVPGLISLPRIGQTLAYVPVKAGGKTAPREFKDGRSSVHFFSAELEGSGRGAPKFDTAEKQFYLPFIAQEIIRLHTQGGCSFSQFAVLVKDQDQIAKLSQYFRRCGIPFAAQKSSALTETTAYAAFREVLKGIVSPRHESSLKTALASPLIGWTAEDIVKLEDQELWECVIDKCRRLSKIWVEDGFAHFFQEWLKSSWLYPSQATCAEHILSLREGLEMMQDLQQIVELITAYETTSRCRPQEVIDYLDELEKMDAEEEKSLKRRNDPGKEGVRIMTLHSSKGLEFDIVFALGIAKRTPRQNMVFPVVEIGKGPKLVAASGKTDARYLHYCQETDAEKIRLLYVALTRARQRVYIPLLFDRNAKGCEPGTASAMELYVARMGIKDVPFHETYGQISQLDPERVYERILNLGKSLSIGLSVLNGLPMDVAPLHEQQSIRLREPPEPIVPGAAQFIHSFTSLATNEPSSSVYKEPPHNYENPFKSPHTLPAGSEAGNLLHQMLENVPLRITREQLIPYVRKFVQGTRYSAWESVFREMIFNAIHAKLLVQGNDSFALTDVADGRYYREHEFIYPAHGQIHPEFSYKPGYVKGVIDLVFDHQGLFYIVDWKSNWLGPRQEDYQPEQIADAMREHDYYLQAKLYREALQRYLKIFDPRPFPEIYGGTYYLFLRGLQAGSSLGIYKVE